jgi:pimeloyl-ACP methyl ester carboxylesterase
MMLLLFLLTLSGAVASPITMKKPPTNKLASMYHTVAAFGPSGSQEMRYTECRVEKGDDTSSSSTPLVCIHGFGGNADQFRFNLPVLQRAGHSAFAIDLMGYGYSNKPSPKDYAVNELYNFENWATQTTDFIENVVQEPVVLVTNSVGGLVGLQTAANTRPDLIKGVILIDISLRMLHITKQPPLARPLVRFIQDFLREGPFGNLFFSQVAEFNGLKNILGQAYAGEVSDETVNLILEPGLQPGAAAVFLDFISYSSGPLPEDLLPRVKHCKVRILWGESDPWEPIEQGRAYANQARYPCVDEFVPLEGAGHCPMDQVPERVNEEILRYMTDYGL